MLIKENSRNHQTSKTIAPVDTKLILHNNRNPSKIPQRAAPITNRSSGPNRMPAPKPVPVNMPLPHKHPMLIPHKQNLSNGRALSPVIPMNGPRSLMVNNTGYKKHSEMEIVNRGYIQGQQQQHHSYIPTNNIANKHNFQPSGNRGATVINGNGIPLYRQASASSLLTSSSGKQGSNWKMGFSSTVEERNYRPYNEQQMGMEKGPKSLGIPNSQNELRHGTTPKPGKCENKVISRKNCLSNFFCCLFVKIVQLLNW